MPKFDLNEIQRHMDTLPKPPPLPDKVGLPATRRTLAEAAKVREVAKMRKLVGIDKENIDG